MRRRARASRGWIRSLRARGASAATVVVPRAGDARVGGAAAGGAGTRPPARRGAGGCRRARVRSAARRIRRARDRTPRRPGASTSRARRRGRAAAVTETQPSSDDAATTAADSSADTTVDDGSADVAADVPAETPASQDARQDAGRGHDVDRHDGHDAPAVTSPAPVKHVWVISLDGVDVAAAAKPARRRPRHRRRRPRRRPRSPSSSAPARVLSSYASVTKGSLANSDRADQRPGADRRPAVELPAVTARSPPATSRRRPAS